MLHIADPISRENAAKLEVLRNPHVTEQVAQLVALCKPARVRVVTDAASEIAQIRQLALDSGEENVLNTEGHTIHFDGYLDQARDTEHTAVLLPRAMRVSKCIKAIDRDEGLKEITELLDGSMRGRECFVRFFSLGPIGSRFSICAMQLTDSAYVAHSEDLLYRNGYEDFKRLRDSRQFFTLVHSSGELDEGGKTKNIDKRRIYIDFVDGKAYSVNTQYAGNSLGLKKLALRLGIHKANKEGWLAEHMLIMGIHSPGKSRVTYFTGAYPSACGKTSTAMIPGQSIVGDDIAYIREDCDGNARAVNIESGIFGIAQDVNPLDDPLIYNALTTPRELVFSNVLVNDGVSYWLGMGRNDIPEYGVNHSGEWKKGNTDARGREISFAHPNARFTMRLNELENVDPHLNDREGLVISGIFYGGRDSDTNVPISEASDWNHGVFMGATIESETTSATLRQTGVRNSDPMALMDFMVVPLGLYLSNHIKFGNRLRSPPKVFSTNYFLKHEGKYTNEKLDKKAWVIWAEGRVHSEYDAVKTPIGYMPLFEDLRALFKQLFNRNYGEDDYVLQYSVRLDRQLEKLGRMETFFSAEPDIPAELWEILRRQRAELSDLKAKTGETSLPPSFFGA